MEIFYEQNVSDPKIDKHRKRTTVLSVLRKVFLALAIILGFIGVFTLQRSTALGIVFQIVFVVLIVAPLALAFWLLGRFIRNTNSEYDYILHGNIFRIVKVIRRSRRKLMATIPIDHIESIGKIDSESYERYAATKSVKKQFAVCNYEEEDKIVYIRYRNEGEDFLLHIEPDEEMIVSLRRSLPRISIMDKGMNAPVTGQKIGYKQ